MQGRPRGGAVPTGHYPAASSVGPDQLIISEHNRAFELGSYSDLVVGGHNNLINVAGVISNAVF